MTEAIEHADPSAFEQKDAERLLIQIASELLTQNQESGRAVTTRTPISGEELDMLSLLYDELDQCDSAEAAVEGFRIGWECGSLNLVDIPFTNRPWRRSTIEPEWCAIHDVDRSAFEYLAELFAFLELSPGRVVRLAFEFGYLAPNGRAR